MHSRSKTCFLGPTQVHTPNGISIGSAVFAKLTAGSVYTLQWASPFPSKLPLRIGGSGLPSDTWFLGPNQVHNPHGISIGSAVFAKHTIMTDRQTDRQTTLHCL